MTKVTIQRDICLNLIVPLTATHNFIPLPPFPPVPPPLPAVPLSLAACAIESPVNAWWPPGGALGSHKFTSTVFHAGQTICLDGHDCGKFIPHLQVAPGPNNMLTFMHIPFSARKANFCASTVLMNGKPTAGMTAIAWPPTPMTYCAEPISMPLADAPTSHFNTVEVHITWQDWLAGAIGIAAGMILDWVFRKSSRSFGQDAGRDIARNRAGVSVRTLLKEKIIKKLKSSFDREWVARQSVGALTGTARILVTGQGSASFNAPFGSGYFGTGVTVSRDNKGVTGGLTGNALTESVNLDTRSAGHTHRNPNGLGQNTDSNSWNDGSSHTETNTSDPFGGFQNETTTTNKDGTSVGKSDGPGQLPKPPELPNQL
jgi:hypothetical protein